MVLMQPRCTSKVSQVYSDCQDVKLTPPNVQRRSEVQREDMH